MSSILIKGATMPKWCIGCPCCDKELQICDVLKRDIPVFDDKLPDCPLVEVPPHGRLIDADEISEDIRKDISLAEEALTYVLTQNARLNLQEHIEMDNIFSERLDDAPTVIESEEQEHE